MSGFGFKLGYSVASSCIYTDGILGFAFTVTSNSKLPYEVEERFASMSMNMNCYIVLILVQVCGLNLYLLC